MATQATIPSCDADTDRQSMIELLDEAGCLVIEGLAGAEAIEAVRAELAPTMAAIDAEADDPEDFYPGKTRRAIALMARSPTMRALMMNPTIEALCDHHLLGNCDRYQVHVTAALEVGPGARDQILHREEDPFAYFKAPRPNMILATMWALSDFTTANGGTQMVPGSHHWEANREAEAHEIVRAEMSAGSVLVWLGGTLHGAGANVTDGWRYGAIVTYSLGWLRQEENQHLSIPLAQAMALPEAMRNRLGFAMNYNEALGFYDPTVVLNDRAPG